MAKIVTSRPPKRAKRKKDAAPLKARVVSAKSPAQVKKAKRIRLLRERGY